MGIQAEKTWKIFDKSTQQWIEVPKETYDEHTQYYNVFRQRNRDRGECICPRNMLWRCDGNCSGCEYQQAGRKLSLDYTNENEEGDICSPVDYLAEQTSTIEEDFCRRDEMNRLLEHLYRLMPEAEQIGKLRLEGYTDGQIAEMIGIDRSTFRLRLKKIKVRLAALYPELLKNKA